MSSRSKKFFVGVIGAIILAFFMAGVATVSYNAGRNAVSDELVTSPTAITAVEDGSVSIDSVAGNDDLQDAAAEQVDEADVQSLEESTLDSNSSSSAGQADDEQDAVPAAVESGESEPAQDAELPVIEQGPRIPVQLDKDDVDLLLEVWEIIDEDFDGQLPDDEDVTYSAIAGSLELLEDRYTRFINPAMAERLREQLNGSFEGIGAFVDLDEDGHLVIVRPIEDQPADRAGLLAGDIVTHVNGESVIGMALEEITADIKGPKGTEVTLTIWRETLDEPFEVTLTRQLIEYPIVQGEMLEEDIAYARLTSFSGNSAKQLEELLKELLDEDPRALILDLRDNPGGFLSQSVEVADLLLTDGVVLYERDGRELEEVFESEDGDLAEDIQLVLLVNGGSASASEIVAGAVQDRGRGILVGETTLGKGSVQQPHTLSDGSELRVTIARWYTPNNQSIDANGIVPDIESASPEEFGTEADTQLQRAITYILEGR